LPASATVEEFIELAPEWLRDTLRAVVPRELGAEAAGRGQHRTFQTHLALSAGREDRDE
jgi:hypothetical protein